MTFDMKIQKLLLQYSLPLVVTNFFNILLPSVDQMMVGHLGKNQLSASALGNTWFNFFWFFCTGVATYFDTLASQNQDRQSKEMNIYTLKTCIISLEFLGIFFSIFLLLTELVMEHLFFQDKEVTIYLSEFCIPLVLGVPLFLLTLVLQKYLQCKKIFRTGIIIGLISNVFNAIVNYIFIYILNLGLLGASLATSMTRIMQCFMYIYYLYKNDSDIHLITHGCIKINSVKLFLQKGFHGGIMVCLEVMCFQTTIILAGLLNDSIQLNAHVILLTIISLTFYTFPFAFSVATNILVGNYIGATEYKKVKYVSFLSLFFGSLFMLLLSLILYFVKYEIPYAFTNNRETVEKCAELTLIACCFQLFDGFQAIATGVFRGLGLQKKVAQINLFGFWIVGIPIGVFLTFYLNTGVIGLWWGICSGLFVICMTYIYLLYHLNWNSIELENIFEENNSNEMEEVL